MANELILIFNLIFVFGTVLISYMLFERWGLIAWTVIATIVANIEVLILIEAFGITHTLGNIMFASTFLVTDILSELYGKNEAKRAVNIGIFTSVSFVLISQFWFFFTPSPDDWASPYIYKIFSNTPRLMITGFLVYAIAQRFDVWLYHLIWNITKTRTGSKRAFLWLRNNTSTMTSQLLNTVLFTLGAFLGVYETKSLIDIMTSSYLLFLATSLLDTPFVYFARMWHDKKILPKHMK